MTLIGRQLVDTLELPNCEAVWRYLGETIPDRVAVYVMAIIQKGALDSLIGSAVSLMINKRMYIFADKDATLIDCCGRKALLLEPKLWDKFQQ